MRLKTFFWIGVGALGITGLTVAATLVSSTTMLTRTASLLGDSVESVYSAEEAEIALLDYNREALLHEVRPDGGHDRKRAEALASLDRWVSRLNLHASSPREAALAEHAREKVTSYLARRVEDLPQGATPLDQFVEAHFALDEAYQSLEDLIALNRTQSQALMQRVAILDQRADLIGGLAAAATILVIAAFLAALHWLINRPIERLRRVIARVSKGEREARASLKGPQELRDVANTFNEMADTLARQRESQLRYLAGVAHDLRNPVGAIKMATELLLPPLDGSDPVPDSPAESAETLQVIQRQVGSLDHMIGDLLDTTRIESGNLSLRPESTDLAELARQAAALYKASSPRHRLLLQTPHKGVPCRCDPLRVSQVLNNLVSNAIKYSPAGGDVTLTVEQQGAEAIVNVTDEGLGLAKEDLSGIFEPFRRTALVRDTIPGVGLGLSVARRIVEAHGGRLEVKSRLGVGTSFSVYLPTATT